MVVVARMVVIMGVGSGWVWVVGGCVVEGEGWGEERGGCVRTFGLGWVGLGVCGVVRECVCVCEGEERRGEGCVCREG